MFTLNMLLSLLKKVTPTQICNSAAQQIMCPKATELVAEWNANGWHLLGLQELFS